ANAPTVRWSCGTRRQRKLFSEPIDVGLSHRLCFMLVGISSESGRRLRSPAVVLWGARRRTSRRRWDVYFLGRDRLRLAHLVASLVSTSGLAEGLTIDTKDIAVPADGTISPLLRYDGESVGMYN